MVSMIMGHEIYLGEIIFNTVKNELVDDDFVWFKQERKKLEDETFRETNFFLTKQHLIKVEIVANRFTIQKIDRNEIKKVKKEFIIENYRKIKLNKAIIYYKDQNEDDLYLIRPNEDNPENVRRFEEFVKLL